MAETTLTDIVTASQDADLMDRLTAAAAKAKVPGDPRQWALIHAMHLAAQPVTEGGDTIASVYAYAVATYTPTSRPGQNPAAVTDTYLTAAVTAIKEATNA